MQPTDTLPRLLAETTASGLADAQTYIFWAYGLACILLFAMNAWLIGASKSLDARLRYLEERLERGGTSGPQGTNEA